MGHNHRCRVKKELLHIGDTAVGDSTDAVSMIRDVSSHADMHCCMMTRNCIPEMAATDAAGLECLAPPVPGMESDALAPGGEDIDLAEGSN